MKTNYVLIDYENVQPDTLDLLDQAQVQIMVFVGGSQAKIAFDVAVTLQRMGPRATYIKISGNGPNALDFHIAFYIGKLAAREPDAYFHIISKDTGFDPLITHLKCQKLRVYRAHDVLALPFVTRVSAPAFTEKLAAIVADLKRRGAAKPRTTKTLATTINSLFQQKLSEPELASLLHELQTKGLITVSDTRVVYTLPV